MKAHLLYHGEVCVEQYCQHAGGGGGGGGGGRQPVATSGSIAHPAMHVSGEVP